MLSATAAYLGGVILTSKAAHASLNIYSRSNTSSSWNSSTERVLKIYAKAGSFTTDVAFSGAVLVPTGLGVSCSGAGAVATLLIAFKGR